MFDRRTALALIRLIHLKNTLIAGDERTKQ